MNKPWSAAGAACSAIAGVAAALVLSGADSAPALLSASAPARVDAASLVSHTRATVAAAQIGAMTAPTERASSRPAASTGSLMVRFQRGVSSAAQEQAVKRDGGSERAVIPALDLHVVDVPSARLGAVADAYRADRAVKSVEADHIRHAGAVPSDPSYASQWALPQIGWDQLFGSVTPGGSATVAVLDTGVDGSHPDLAGRLVAGYSAFAGSDPATDPNGHGTWMAGIAAAATDNAAGIAGVAYSGVSIMPVQVLDASGVGQDSDIVNGVIWAADHGADVIVMSFSNTGYSQDLQDAIAYAWSKGAVLVAATGNDGSSTITYPAGDTYVMGVSGTDQSDALASESNYGVDTFVAAPSEDVLTTDAGGAYRSISGTSASAAIVAGVAAFERALDPSLSNGAIDGRIARNADPAGTQDQTGNGRVNMERTVGDTSTDPVVPVGAGAGGGSFVGPYTDAAAATDGSGTMTVSPTSVTAGSAPDSFAFNFRIPNKTGNFAGQVRVFFPEEWGQPQTSAASAGFVSIASQSNCSSASISGIAFDTSGWWVTINATCNSRKRFILNYTHVTAPTTAHRYTFLTQTRLTSGTFTNIAASPVITVTPVDATPTQTGLVLDSPSPITYGDTAHFTATVVALGGAANPTTGQGTVDFVDTLGGSTLCAAVPLTNNTATCSVNTLDAGSYSVQAQYSGTTTTPAFAGSSSGQVGLQVNPASTQTALSSSSNPSTVGSSVTFTATVTAPSRPLQPSSDGTVTFNDGATTICAAVALIGNTATCTTSALTVGTHWITASYSSASGDFNGSMSSTLGQQVDSGVATHFAVTGYPSPTTAGANGSFTVTALDSLGNTVTSYTGEIGLVSSDLQALFAVSDYTFVAADHGAHTFDAALFTAGTQSISAIQVDDHTIQGSQENILVNPGPTMHLHVFGFPSPTTAGGTETFTVTAVDQYGNTTPDYAGTVHFTSSDAQATLPSDYTFVAGDGGTKTFPATLRTAGTQSINAADGAVIVGRQIGILVNPAATSALLVSGYPTDTIAGDQHHFTVTAQDAYGNTTPSYTDGVFFDCSDLQATCPGFYTFQPADHGIHIFSATMRTAGTQSITAVDDNHPDINGTEFGINVEPGPTAAFLVQGYANPATAGAGSTFTVSARDQFGNIATDYAGTVHITSSDPQAQLPGDYAYQFVDQGSHTFPGTLFTAGMQSITATDTGSSSVTGSQTGIVVRPGPTSAFTVAGYASPTTAGDSHTFTVTAHDAYGNATPAYTGTVHFTSSDAQASLPGDYTFVSADNGVQTFSASLETAGAQSITATDSGSSAITGSQTGIVVIPAPTSAFTVAGYASPTTAGDSHTFTVTAHDAYGNTTPAYTGTVHFTSSDGQADLPIDYTFAGADAGVHTFDAALKTAGSQSITATDGSITGSQSGITVVPAPTSTLALGGFPLSTVAGASHTFTVTAQDPYGNTTPAYTGTVQFSSSDSQATVPGNYTFVAADGGIHTFSATLKTVGSQSITGTDTAHSAITGTQSGITVTPAPASHYVVAGPIGSVQVGTPFGATVTAVDPYGNTDTNYAGTLHWTSSDASAVLPADYTFQAGDAGVRAFTITLDTYGTGSQTITATDAAHSGITGSTAVSLTKVPVSITGVSASAVSPNTTIQFSDSVQLNATVDSSSSCCGPLTGTVAFQVNGHPAGTAAVNQTGASAVHATVRLDDTVIPSGAAGSPYTVTATFTSSNANYANGNGTGSVAVTQEGTGIPGSVLTYTGDNYVLNTAVANLSVNVEQRDPAADSQYIDYSKSPVWVRFDVTLPPSTTPVRTVFAQVQNSGDWSTTGHGFAKTTLGSTLTDQAYAISAHLVVANGSPVTAVNPYIHGDGAASTLTSSPATNSFVSGGGFIAPANGANTANTHGNFGFTIKFNKSMTNLQGNLVYVYRRNMDVGGGTYRDVDVIVKSNSLSYLKSDQSSSTTGTAIATGKFSVQYVDSLTGTVYSSLGFGNGSFQLNITDGGTGGANDKFALALKNPDGSTYYLSSGSSIDSSGSAQQVTITGGNITVHQ